MNKLLLFALLVLFSFRGIAQSFTIPHDTVTAVTSTSQNMYNNITNVSSAPISVSWRVTAHDFPADWQASFAVCDNKLCYYNVNGSLMSDFGGGLPKTTNPIDPNQTANFYVLPDVTNANPGTHYVGIDMSDGLYSKVSWYIISKWATGVTTVNPAIDGFSAYPNPATGDITVFHLGNNTIKHVELYDLSGKKMAQYKAGENTTKIDLAALANGFYLIKLVDDKGHLVGSLKVDHK